MLPATPAAPTQKKSSVPSAEYQPPTNIVTSLGNGMQADSASISRKIAR
jgi:hypothetical protein